MISASAHWHAHALAAMMALLAAANRRYRSNPDSHHPMRRWLLIILLLVYPFQVTLAMADQCCVTTPSGVSHHDATLDDASEVAVMLADDAGSPLADPHCPACVFGHLAVAPPRVLVLPDGGHHAALLSAVSPFFTSLPATRPERPKWRAAD